MAITSLVSLFAIQPCLLSFGSENILFTYMQIRTRITFSDKSLVNTMAAIEMRNVVISYNYLNI